VASIIRGDVTGAEMGTTRETRTVAILDDSVLTLEMTRRALEQGGFRTEVARTLADLEALLARGVPDLLIVDVNMPEMYGDDVATVLKTVRKVRVPICLFSNRADADLAERASRARADAYVSKARGFDELLRCVRRMLYEAR
jgi:DNA-binding response OmpR family regulator